MTESFETAVKLRLIVPAGEVDRVKKIVNSAVNPSIIKRIQAVPSMLGIGGGPSAATIAPGAGAGASLMSGIGGMAGQLGIIAAIANQALEFLGKIVGFMAQSSPALRNVMYQFNKAMMIFFRPFGDFLAAILRPMARGLLKMSRDWLKWTRGSTEEKLMSIMDMSLKAGIESLFSGVKITDLIGGAVSIWKFISDTSKSIWDFVSPVLKPIWDFVSNVAKDIWTWVTDASKSIWDFIDTSFKSIWDFVTTSTKPIWEFIVSEMRPIWFWITDVSKSMWTWITDVTRDIWYWITNISKSIWDWITTEVKSVWDFIVTPIRSIWDFITGGGSNWGGGGGGSTVKDFIWRPGQAPQSISSTDTVVGTKSKSAGLGSVSINLGGINIEKVSSDYDIKRIGDLVADQIIIKLRSMT